MKPVPDTDTRGRSNAQGSEPVRRIGAKPDHPLRVQPHLVPRAARGLEAPPVPGPSPISQYIDLEIEARQCCDLDTLRLMIINQTRKLAPYDQAFLVEPAYAGGWHVTRASSVSKIDVHSPLIRMITAWVQHPKHTETMRGSARIANMAEEARDWGLDPDDLASPFAMWLPLTSRSGEILAAVIALKKDAWRSQQSALLMTLAGAYAHAWSALAPRPEASINRVRRHVSKSRIAWGLGAAALIAGFLPVPMSALAPAEVVAAKPMLVTAPIEGVIGDILAPPGTWVDEGAVIVRFVDVKLRSDVEVAARNTAVAQARHFKVLQSAIATQQDMQELAIAKAELDVASAELSSATELLARSQIRAERSGLLIYAAKSDWIGKPVAVGERLMEIGDPARTEIRIELPVSDAFALKPGGRVALFLDGDPLRGIEGAITRTSYRPTATAGQALAFMVYAAFDDARARRIGLHGIARVSGDPVPLWFYLFRRPIAAVRQKAGL